MTTLKLADNLRLPADEAVTQKYGFIGRSGSGKSYAAMRLAELFLNAGAQIIALDWVGIWWSLRLAGNGKDVGFPNVYIFGGEHADVDLRPESGALMADLVVDRHISVVLDVMHFRKADRTRFATAFAEQFFHRKKTARSACHLFIEEAQAYLPQMVRGEEARMVGVFEDIGKVGRNYGIGNSLISQRPQAINKDVLNQVEVLLAFQTNGPQERKAIAGWTAENTTAGAAMMQELPKLRVGDALVWSPQWLRIAEQLHISKRETYDASSTPTGAAKAIKPKTLAKADLEQLGEQIAATIEKAKQDDPKELRKQIAELQKQVKAAATAKPAEKYSEIIPKVVEKPVLKDGQIARLEALEHRVGELSTKLFDLTGQLQETWKDIKAAVALTRQPPPVVRPQNATPKPHVVASPRRNALSAPSDGTMGRVHRAFLTVLANRQGKPTRRNQLAVFSGYSAKSRHVDNTISNLRTLGFVSGGSDALVITDAGLSALGPWDELPTGQALIDYWIREAGAAPGAMLKVLVDVHPNTLSRDEVAERSGYSATSRHVDNSLSYLRTLELIEGDRYALKASDELFS